MVFLWYLLTSWKASCRHLADLSARRAVHCQAGQGQKTNQPRRSMFNQDGDGTQPFNCQYVCVYNMCIYIYTYTCVCVSTCIHIYIYIHIQIKIYIYMYLLIQILIYTYIQVDTYDVYMCVYIHTYIYIYIIGFWCSPVFDQHRSTFINLC